MTDTSDSHSESLEWFIIKEFRTCLGGTSCLGALKRAAKLCRRASGFGDTVSAANWSLFGVDNLRTGSSWDDVGGVLGMIADKRRKLLDITNPDIVHK